MSAPTSPCVFKIFCCLIALSQSVFSGCAKYESLKIPSQRMKPSFSLGGNLQTPDRWWTSFSDSQLSQQVEIALAESNDLTGALQRIRSARALARREASDLFPDLDGIVDKEFLFRSPGPESSRYLLGLEMSYQVDLWGEIESRVKAQNLRASATDADYHATALSLSAEIARVWFSLIEANAQLELLNDQIKTNLTGVELQEARFGLGQIRSADVLRQRQLVEATLEQSVVAQARIEILEHQLAVLQGRTPQDTRYEATTQLPELPPLPKTGLPSELVNRRPDVRREYLALLAADRDFASAVSTQYPRLNLSASVATVTESPENLFREWAGSIAGQLIAPLIDGGQRKAEVDRRKAIVQEQFANYTQLILIAYQEVEDALTREQYQYQRITHLENQLKFARQASTQLREQYLIGDVDYLDVLSAITGEQRLQRETLSARLDLVLNRIALYLALAGDFEPRPSIPSGGVFLETVGNE